MGHHFMCCLNILITILRDGKCVKWCLLTMCLAYNLCVLSLIIWDFDIFIIFGNAFSAISYFSILYKKWPLQTKSLYVLLIASRINFPILDFIKILKHIIRCNIILNVFWNFFLLNFIFSKILTANKTLILLG